MPDTGYRVRCSCVSVAGQRISVPAGFAQLVNTSNGQQHVLFSPSPPTATGFSTATAGKLVITRRVSTGQEYAWIFFNVRKRLRISVGSGFGQENVVIISTTRIIASLFQLSSFMRCWTLNLLFIWIINNIIDLKLGRCSTHCAWNNMRRRFGTKLTAC